MTTKLKSAVTEAYSLAEHAQQVMDTFVSQRGEQGDDDCKTILVSPACEEGCLTCYRACAIRWIKARTLTAMAAEEAAKAGTMLTHNGIIYATIGEC